MAKTTKNRPATTVHAVPSAPADSAGFGITHWHVGAAAILLASMVWAYWPTLVQLVSSWESEPDYSHGYFVVPIALWFLWVRRDRFPKGAVRPALYSGLAIVLATLVVRYVGARFFLARWMAGPWFCGWRGW